MKCQSKASILIRTLLITLSPAGEQQESLEVMDRDEELVPGINDAPESDDRITISDEVVQQLEWMEPLTDDNKPGLPRVFKANNWGEAAYLEALVRF
jgi:hypothetical protein